MGSFRVIARLDIKGPNLIKGIRLEGLRVMGNPGEFARKYYESGIDELIFMDVVASLYGRNNLSELVSKTASDVFIPLTVGGGIRTVENVKELLKSGADKIAINTAAVKNPKIITEIAERFGSQCVVLSIEAKRKPSGGWEAYTDGGRERTGLDAVEWIKQGASLGAGEILLTSVDQEGTRKGFDLTLVKAATSAVAIPVIASGGFNNPSDLMSAASVNASAIAIADALHYGRYSIAQIKSAAAAQNIEVRSHE